MTTDLAILDLLQRYVLEPANQGFSWPTGRWDREEVLAYLSEAQLEFVRRTHILRGWQDVDYTATAQVTLPQEILAVLHADTFQADVWRPCPPLSRHEAKMLPLTGTRPLGCLLRTASTTELELYPTPTAAGRLQLLVVPLPQPITGTGDPLSVGRQWMPFFLAEAASRMFQRPGDGHDPDRATRLHGVFELGVQGALTRRTTGRSA